MDRRKEFEEVVLPQLPSLFHFALKLTRSGADAQDLVQEATLRAYRRFDLYEPGTNIKAWLFRIVRNTWINRYRASRARPREVPLEDAWAGEGSVPGLGPPTPEEAVLDGVVADDVSRAIDALPEAYRSVVVLVLLEEMSYREVAETLSIPIGTVMSRLHRGRRLLQDMLRKTAERSGIRTGGRGFPPGES